MLKKDLLLQTIEHLEKEAITAHTLARKWAKAEGRRVDARPQVKDHNYTRATNITTAVNALRRLLPWAQ